jgi:hypothetical protein
MHNVTVAKSSPKMGASAEMFIKLPTVSNHPMGENLTYLVTLFPSCPQLAITQWAKT